MNMEGRDGVVGEGEAFVQGCRKLLGEFHGEDCLTIVFAVLRALSSRPQIAVPPSVSWEALQSGRASNATHRLIRCCADIDEANTPFFGGALRLLAQRNCAEGAEAAAAVKAVLNFAQIQNCSEFNSATWGAIAEEMSWSLAETCGDHLSQLARKALQKVLPKGNCLVVGGVGINLRDLNRLQADRRNDVSVFVRATPASYHAEAMVRLISFIGSGDSFVKYAPSSDMRFSSAVVLLSGMGRSRRSAEEIRAQIDVLQQAFSELDDAGVLFAVVRDSLLIGDGIEEQFRRSMVGMDALDSIIVLPSGVKPRTSTADSMVVLRKKKAKGGRGHVRFVDASTLEFSSPDSEARHASTDVGGARIAEAVAIDDLGEFAKSRWNLCVETRRIESDRMCSWDLLRYKTQPLDHIQIDRGLNAEVMEQIKLRDALAQQLVGLFAKLEEL